MYIHNLNPIIFDFGILSLRWYSLAYLIGIIFGWWYGKKIISSINNRNKDKYNLDLFDDYITYVIISIIVGGRLGYVLFYNFGYFLSNPIEIFFIWRGGMSFHGGLLGIIVATIIFSKKNDFDKLVLLDVISCVAPVGIFFGRLANFVNGELYGKPTDLPYPQKKGGDLTDMSTPQLETFASNAVKKNPRAAQAAMGELERRETSKLSMQASEAVRRANIEGRDPQMVLRSMGFGV